jgi:DNA invertase Pin-like site-specific DNA recombinase
MRVVIYGVKSSPDEKGAVDDQHRQVLEAIEREGDREVVGTFGEENESGYRKSRGPELERAMRAATDAANADGEAELWVWHPSRLARGTGKKGEAQSLTERVTYLLRRGVTVRSLERGDMLERPVLLGVEDEQGRAYSQNLGTWVKAGLSRRKAAGKPVGAIPFGYAVEPELDAGGKLILDSKGKVVNRRVVDPKLGPLRVEILERVAGGATPGTVARWLNRQGVKTRRGKQFTRRAVRQIVESDPHGNGYPALVSADMAQAARDELRRVDPAAAEDRKGGRPARDDSYILRGIVFCVCGAPLRRQLPGRAASLRLPGQARIEGPAHGRQADPGGSARDPRSGAPGLLRGLGGRLAR